MKRFDILSKDTDVLGKYFLEASAGTGKTFTIQHLVARLLIETDTSIDQILVVTFTKAATRELKVRIRENLCAILDGSFSCDYLNFFKDESAAGREKAKASIKKIEAALFAFDQAQIYTIHGFCNKMLQEFAFEADLGLETGEWTKKEERALIKEFFRTKLSPEKYSVNQISSVLKKFQHNFSKLQNSISSESPVEEILEDFDKVHKEICKKLCSLKLSPLREEFCTALSFYKGVSHPKYLEQAQFLEEIVRRKSVTEKELDVLLSQTPFFLHYLTPDNRKVRALNYTLPDCLEAVRQELYPLILKASSQLSTYKRIAKDWQYVRDEMASKQEVLDPDSILEKMRESLANGQFLEQVQKKYEAVIVDEFQDTDPTQWEIFERLFALKDMAAFYLVGDLKQAIYSFRKADIYTYMRARETFPQERIASLDVNYRSNKILGESLNQLFCLNDWIDLPAWDQQVKVSASSYFKNSEEGGIHFFVAEGSLGREKRWPTKEIEENYLFPFMLHEIQRLRLPLDQVAILVKDRFQAQRVQLFFQNFNIPSSLKRGQSLSESRALAGLQELFEGLEDERFLKKALAGPLIRWSVDDFDAESIAFAKHKASHLQTVFKKRGFLPFYGEFLQSQFKPGCKTVLQTLVSLESLQLYTDLSEIAEKIPPCQDVGQLLEFLEDLKESESDDRVSSASLGIQILTTHASKGLEFETVFALGTSCRTVVHDESPAELKELDAEKMRQLYVALTRAKARLYVPLLIDTKEKVCALGEGSPLELFWEKTKPILSDFPHTFLNQMQFSLKKENLDTFEDLPLPPPFCRKAPSKETLSFSSLSHSLASPDDSIEENDLLKNLLEKEPLHDPDFLLSENDSESQRVPIGAKTGVLVHYILELFLNSRESLNELVERHVRGTHLVGFESLLFPMLENALSLVLSPKTFSVLDILPEKIQEEMEFIFSTEKAFFKGVIDLCFEKDGKYYILDWKTNYLEDYSQESLKKTMEKENYLLQASIYTNALKRYLSLYSTDPFEELFGGVFYLFIRGPAVYFFQPDLKLLAPYLS